MAKEKINKKIYKIIGEMINDPNNLEMLDEILKIIAKYHGNQYNPTEKGVYKKFAQSLPRKRNIDEMIGDLCDLGFSHGMRKPDNQGNVRWFYYNEELEMFLAVEKDGIMRFCSSYLVPQENTTEHLTSPRIYTVNNLTDLENKMLDVQASKLSEEYNEKLKIKDLPLLSLEDEYQISTKNTQGKDQKEIYDIIPIIRQEIEKQKEEVYETLTFKNILEKDNQIKKKIKK